MLASVDCSSRWWLYAIFFFFFFNDTATTEIYTLSLHDALPISSPASISETRRARPRKSSRTWAICLTGGSLSRDRKSTRLNSSHSQISYAVFCLKKKKKDTTKRSFRSDTICTDVHVCAVLTRQR